MKIFGAGMLVEPATTVLSLEAKSRLHRMVLDVVKLIRARSRPWSGKETSGEAVQPQA